MSETMSGITFSLGPNLLYGVPSLSTKNFPKFQRMSPFSPFSYAILSFENVKTSRALDPFTSAFSKNVNLSLALNFSENLRISS